MALLDDIKARLRVTTDDLGIVGEVQDLIDAAKADLALAGIAEDKIIETDPLIKRAITTYCKANFGYDNPDADRLNESYEMLKQHLSLAQDYSGCIVTFTVTSAGIPINGAIITIGAEVKETNSVGVVIFTTNKTGIDLDYVVTATNYQSITGSVYVDGSKSVEVVLIEV